MNPFATRISGNNMVWAMSAMLAVLGFLITLAWLTQEAKSTRLGSLDPDQASRIRGGTLDLQEEYSRILAEVTKLREDKTRFEKAAAKESGQAKLLNDSLQETKQYAGMTEVEGPGLTVTIEDNLNNNGGFEQDQIIHDVDVLRVVNELWNAGAEAIAVNGNRVSVGTNFRCAGSVMYVGNVRIASPVVVQAIGDPKTLLGGMNLPGGILSELKSAGCPTKVESVKKMRLPAYAGPTNTKFATVPKDAK